MHRLHVQVVKEQLVEHTCDFTMCSGETSRTSAAEARGQLVEAGSTIQTVCRIATCVVICNRRLLRLQTYTFVCRKGYAQRDEISTFMNS